jgi:hypothetical protein
MKERQFTSMAQQRRFERQQHELEKIRQAKAAKNVDGKALKAQTMEHRATKRNRTRSQQTQNWRKENDC